MAVVFTSEFTRSERRDGRPSARAGGHGQQKPDVVTDVSCSDVSRSTNITMEDKRSTHAHSDGISIFHDARHRLAWHIGSKRLTSSSVLLMDIFQKLFDGGAEGH
ncbi:hypothetical protein J6590_102950 [Homalodisca vitripennis]|nr:hypothetical protein J6590_102950 [Homalodisca vitripennis]